MTRLEEDRNVLMRPSPQPSLASLYRNMPLLFSVAGWAEPKQDMNCSSFENNYRMQAQTTVKETKMVCFLLETGAVAGAQDIKQEKVVDEIKLVCFQS